MRARVLVIGTLLMALGSSCGTSDSEAEPVTGGAEAPVTTTQTGDRGDTTEPVTAPSGTPLVEGLEEIVALGPSEHMAGDVPLFRWQPVAGAAGYGLTVLGPDGPLWAWQGGETEVYLGGLPIERPMGMGGPVLTAAACWSLFAFDTDGHVVASSGLLPISPGESSGHSCTPGSGA